MARCAVFLTLIAVASGILIGPSKSAVRTCADVVENSGGGQTEKEAKTNALSGWVKKAEALGVAQAGWQIAAERSLQCQATGGSFYCSARARPCVVKQVAPEGWHRKNPRDVQQ